MESQKLLLVEGTDDEHVLRHICGSRKIRLDEIKPSGGIDNLKSDLSFLIETFGQESDNVIGAIVDADLDVSSRWQAIRNLVSGAGYKDVPSNLNPNGMIFDSSDADRAYLPRLGVWVMPNVQEVNDLVSWIRRLYFLD